MTEKKSINTGGGGGCNRQLVWDVFTREHGEANGEEGGGVEEEGGLEQEVKEEGDPTGGGRREEGIVPHLK